MKNEDSVQHWLAQAWAAHLKRLSKATTAMVKAHPPTPQQENIAAHYVWYKRLDPPLTPLIATEAAIRASGPTHAPSATPTPNDNNGGAPAEQWGDQLEIRWDVYPFFPATAPSGPPVVRPKCECGAASCGSNVHSTWCPLS